MDKVSIVIPCFNHAEFIGDAIESVLKQSYTNFEVFVFDNGSVDDSWNVIQRYDDERLFKIRLEKNDLLEVKKQFAKMATGSYFAILYSDDIWFYDKLEKQMNFLKKNRSARICFTWAEQVDEDLKPAPGFVNYSLNKNLNKKQRMKQFIGFGNLFSCSSVIMDKELYNTYFCKLYPYRQIADMFCWMKIYQETDLHILEEVLVYQRMHSGTFNMNESARTRSNIVREQLELKQVMFKILDEMSDAFFQKYVIDSDELHNHMETLIGKFMFMKDDMRGTPYGREVAVSFYEKYFDYEENGITFYQYLERKYGFSRNDYFALTAVEDEQTSILYDRLERLESLENTDFSVGQRVTNDVVIYGCGRVGKILAKKINHYCRVVAILDRNPSQKEYEGIPICLPTDISLNDSQLVVIVPMYDFDVIKEELLKINKELKENNIIGFKDFIKLFGTIEKNF